MSSSPPSPHLPQLIAQPQYWHGYCYIVGSMKSCQYCGESLALINFKDQYTYRRAKFCSRQCYDDNRIPTYENVSCPQCTKVFTRINSRKIKKEFCSVACQYNARLIDGHKYITPQGYVAIKKHGHPLAYSNGYVLEHRLVLSEKLGRLLTEDEHVHHIDEDKTNNDPSNLELTTNSNHAIIHNAHERLNTPEAVCKRIQTRWGHN